MRSKPPQNAKVRTKRVQRQFLWRDKEQRKKRTTNFDSRLQTIVIIRRTKNMTRNRHPSNTEKMNIKRYFNVKFNNAKNDTTSSFVVLLWAVSRWRNLPNIFSWNTRRINLTSRFRKHEKFVTLHIHRGKKKKEASS